MFVIKFSRDKASRLMFLSYFCQLHRSFLSVVVRYKKKSSSLRMSKVFPSFGLLASAGLLADSLSFTTLFIDCFRMHIFKNFPFAYLNFDLRGEPRCVSFFSDAFPVLDFLTSFNRLIVQLYPADTSLPR